jgi:hypothetical protein
LTADTVAMLSVMPGTPSGLYSSQHSSTFTARLAKLTYMGNHGFCMLWNARLSMMLELANTRPTEKNASAPATSTVALAPNCPRSYTSCTKAMGMTANQATNGSETNTIWRTPSDTVSRKRVSSFCAANRESDGKRTVPMVTAKMPCGSWYNRNA